MPPFATAAMPLHPFADIMLELALLLTMVLAARWLSSRWRQPDVPGERLVGVLTAIVFSPARTQFGVVGSGVGTPSHRQPLIGSGAASVRISLNRAGHRCKPPWPLVRHRPKSGATSMSDRLHCDAPTPGRRRVRAITPRVSARFAAALALARLRASVGP